MGDCAQEHLVFPCSFPLKAVGKGGEDFEDLVISILRKHVPDLDEEAVVTQPSSHGKYLSVTATFIAESREQLDALYEELNSNERVLVTL